MASTNYYEQLIKVYTFSNTPLLATSGATFLVGYLQYVYAIRLLLREGQNPIPFWMHCFYLAHDSTWAYILGTASTQYDGHWFLRGASTALVIWTTLEIFCIHRDITKNRNANFSSLFGRNPALGPVLFYTGLLTLGMYAVVIIVILLMGEGCVFQWFVLTNVLMIMGPVHGYLQRGSRQGLSLGFCTLNIFCALWTFSPFSMWVLALPEIFDHPAYYSVGVVFFIYSLWAFYIVYSYPPKPASKKDPHPIW